jgi:hypothetical protein
MGVNRGRNAGLTGLVDLPGLGGKFEARLYGWKPRLTGATRPRRGRGGGLFRSVRWLFSAGTIAASGKVRLDGWPSPDQWKGQTGTITVTLDAGKTIAYPVMVTGHGFDFDEKTEDTPSISLSFEVTGAPTYSGWPGTQPAATDPTKADQEQYEGTSKTIDPQGLVSGAVRVIDVWGTLADTDTAETSKLTTAITAAAAAVPFTGLKVRNAALARDAIDGGTITITFGLTDTGEDVTNPQTRTTTDAQNIASEATSAAINATPATPTGDSFVKRTSTTQELNDAKTLNLDSYGLRDTAEDITMPGTVTGNDPQDLEDNCTITLTNGSGTPPADPAAPQGQLVLRTSEQVNREKWKHTYTYANTNSQQKVEFPATISATTPRTCRTSTARRR